MISNWSYSPETLNLGQNYQIFGPCDLKLWQMTLKNSGAPHPAPWAALGWISLRIIIIIIIILLLLYYHYY